MLCTRARYASGSSSASVSAPLAFLAFVIGMIILIDGQRIYIGHFVCPLFSPSSSYIYFYFPFHFPSVTVHCQLHLIMPPGPCDIYVIVLLPLSE